MLTDIAIKSGIREAKPAGKPLKRFDEKGLYLLIKPSGAALWRLKYVFGVKKATAGKRKGKLVGIEKGIGLGAYKDVPLKRAREKRDDARKLVADGVDPSAVRKAQRVAQPDSVEALARARLDQKQKKRPQGTHRPQAR